MSGKVFIDTNILHQKPLFSRVMPAQTPFFSSIDNLLNSMENFIDKYSKKCSKAERLIFEHRGIIYVLKFSRLSGCDSIPM
jgi:hypothetical protein